MKEVNGTNNWEWWPLFPLYPYRYKKTICREIVPGQIWSLEQIQGLYYVAVPIRMTLIKMNDGLMIINPLTPTKELVNLLNRLVSIHGEIKTIVLPTASGLEHKIGLPALIRNFRNSEIWVCPGQWSFPINLPLDFIGIPSKRTKILFENGTPYDESCIWSSLGPINLGLGNFQEVSCFHKPSGTLHVTDAIIGIDRNPPEIFDFDPTPLLFHARDRGDEPLLDSLELREKGWARLVLFSSFLRPGNLKIPSLKYIFKYSFKKGLRNKKAHFGLYPFLWEENWESSLSKIIGNELPKIQVAPVLQKLIFPRSKQTLINWLESIKKLEGLKYLISAHYCSPIDFTQEECQGLIKDIDSANWENYDKDDEFLSKIYRRLYQAGIIPNS